MSKPLALPALPRSWGEPFAGVTPWPALGWLLAIGLALQAMRLAWLLVVPPAPWGALPPASREAAPSAGLAIDAFHPAAAAVAAADTSGLRLHASRPAADGGSAILAGTDGRQRAWSVADEVLPGVRLVEVAADHVVLETSGARRRLDFTAPGATATGARAMPSALPATAADAATGLDAAALLAEAGLRPRTEGGRVAGYSVIPRGDGVALRQAGLEPGDVLLSVNGQALTPERHASLATDLAGATRVTLTFRRGDQTRTTTLQAPAP